MIEKLFIKNYLIIKESELNFKDGLNILTGETGAGKTIILDALGLILGERADYSIIKNNNEKLVIEGHFNFEKNIYVEEFLNTLYNEEKIEATENRNYIILRRELNNKGVSRNFINDNPVPLNILKNFGDLIIDIHSQNEHQSLLNKDTHINIIDNYSDGEDILKKYKILFDNYKKLINEFSELKGKKDNLIERKNFLEFQLKEINNVNPRPEEDNELENELKKMENVEEISSSINNCINLLYESENNILSGIHNVIKELKKSSKFDNELKKLSEELESAYINVKDISGVLSNYNSGVNFDPERIEEIRNRLGALNFLKKKYNLTINELIKKAEELEKELNLTENYDYEIEKKKEIILLEKEKIINASKKLSEIRKKAIKYFENEVNKYLKEVGLENSELKIKNEFKTTNYPSLSDPPVIARSEATWQSHFSFTISKKNILITPSGIDDIEFLIRTNKGGEFSPLRKTASGGEVSRIMLSIKTAMSNKDNVPILVFDEIDAGISGRIADKVGKLLKKLSESHQIISITHLPQIAARSDNHFRVSKKVKDEETIAEIKPLTREEKIEEIAKMLSGEKITAASIKGAKELING
jgi:DNA repair protein RecN (Recombination protein N)